MSEFHSREIIKNLQECTAMAERLALATYRLTDRFPDDEVLCNKMRAVALDIATVLATNPNDDFDRTHGAIAAMLVLIRIARTQQYVSDENFNALEHHYEVLKDGMRQAEEAEKELPPVAEAPTPKKESPPTAVVTPETKETDTSAQALTKRQRKIVIYFKSKPSFQLREVRQLFEGYSQKTLRNDLKELCRLGILEREGVGTVSHYRVIGNIGNSD